MAPVAEKARRRRLPGFPESWTQALAARANGVLETARLLHEAFFGPGHYPGHRVPTNTAWNDELSSGRPGYSRRGRAPLSAQNSVLHHIALPYASALYDLASEAKAVSATEESLDSIAKLINESADFASFLRSPVISAAEKREVVDAILNKAKTDQTVSNFLKLVAKNGRLFALEQIIREFKQLTAAERGEVTADVTSATALNKEQLKTLSDTLKKKIGKTVKLNAHVDPTLIGGLQVKVGSQMIDSSLKTKLTAMKIAMKEVG